MIDDLALRWVVTVLFALSAAECVLAVVVNRKNVGGVIGNLLHLAMAVAMGVMAWPRGAELPTTGPAVFFLLAAGWFGVAALTITRGSPGRALNAYSAAVMLAMAWMYAVMNGAMLPGRSDPARDTNSAMGHPMANMPTMNGHSTGYPGWISAVNWILTLGLVLAALSWLYRYFTARRSAPGVLSRAHFGVLCQTMMAAGMAIMFAVML